MRNRLRKEKMKRTVFVFLPIALACLFLGNILYGAVPVPFRDIWMMVSGKEVSEVTRIIVMESRLPQAVTALAAGSALAVAGLLLQTLFRNPLAGPSILGVSDGANLGVAIVMLCTGGSVSTLGGYAGIVVAAMIGAMAILSVIIWFSHRVRSNTMLLIIGIMVGYLVSSVISILNYYASADKVRRFVMWGLGDFSSVSLDTLPFFSLSALAGILMAVLCIKPLNALLLGENYASNLGINVRLSRIAILLCTGLMTAVVTAFCGPVSFIGLAVPHIARLIVRTSDHRILVPATILCGGCIALACNMLTVMPGSGNLLPLNAVTPVFGAPVIIYIIMKSRK